MMIAAFIWGFSEATFFFIIPDVLLSYYALRNNDLKKIFLLNIICITGAALGGAAVFIKSSIDHSSVIEFMLGVPAIHTYMLEHVESEMAAGTFSALVTGPLFGVPYKLFAAFAPLHTNIFIFILFSIPARFIRFIIVSFLAHLLSHKIFKGLPIKVKTLIWLFVWVIVYIIYFSIHPF